MRSHLKVTPWQILTDCYWRLRCDYVFSNFSMHVATGLVCFLVVCFHFFALIGTAVSNLVAYE